MTESATLLRGGSGGMPGMCGGRATRPGDVTAPGVRSVDAHRLAVLVTESFIR